MRACLAHMPAGLPVCALCEAPGRPGGWLLSRCSLGRTPVWVDLPAAGQPAQPEGAAADACQVRMSHIWGLARLHTPSNGRVLVPTCAACGCREPASSTQYASDHISPLSA